MIKTYALTTPARNSSIVLRGKTGNSLRYNFAGGDLFREGYVRLVRTDEGGEKVKEESKQTFVVEGVTSPEQLIEYVANKLEKVYQRPEAALEFARKNGFEFPNLELKKKEE
jgi:hypothetical protein